jgi:tetratricopeptide (TPR) repeat protein
MGRVALSPLVATPSVEEQATDLFHVAAEAFGDDREDEALELLERAIAVDPGHADSYESLGVILGRHGRYPEAIEFMKRLLEVDPDSVMAHSNMSVYYNQLGRIEEAEREAGLAAEKSLLGQRREQQRADDERQSRQQRQAELKRREAMYLEVLELDPDDTLGNFGMGEVCVEELGRECGNRTVRARSLLPGSRWLHRGVISPPPTRCRDGSRSSVDNNSKLQIPN